MPMSDVYSCEIVSTKMLTDTVFSISVACEGIAEQIRAGQFVNIKCGRENLLRRPLSICGVIGDELRLVYEVKGAGTKWLFERVPGQVLDIHGPLGNGFFLPEGDIIVVGGGVGCPPMLYAATSAKGAVAAVLGFRGAGNIILKDEFESVCDSVCIATEDGSFGIRGTVAGPLEELLGRGEYAAVLACGRREMLTTVASLCARHGVRCQVSLEERIGCGVGACVVCACATVRDGIERMSRVCKDGPIFDASEIAL